MLTPPVSSMSDALDRIAPEDRKGELYRHSAEGLDDMPVCASTIVPSKLDVMDGL
jgi:thiamine phosphate synthase YjbQ (UPF0047 family)